MRGNRHGDAERGGSRGRGKVRSWTPTGQCRNAEGEGPLNPGAPAVGQTRIDFSRNAPLRDDVTAVACAGALSPARPPWQEPCFLMIPFGPASVEREA